MGFILLLLLIGVPILEISIFISVGTVIGLGPTLIMVVGTALIGALLVKKQGLTTLLRAQKSLSNNQLPVQEFFDGLFFIIAGFLLITPGLVTDGIGLLLFLPHFRMFLKKILANVLVARTNTDGYTKTKNKNSGKPTSPIIDGEFETIDPSKTRKQKILN